MKPCSRCGKPRTIEDQKYCRECANAYMREWRKTHPLSDEERRKDNCRSYTNVLIKRGRLLRKPCWVCGEEKVQAHHPDYNQPAFVVWLCKPHHLAYHRYVKTHESTWGLHNRAGCGMDESSLDLARPTYLA